MRNCGGRALIVIAPGPTACWAESRCLAGNPATIFLKVVCSRFVKRLKKIILEIKQDYKILFPLFNPFPHIDAF